MYNIRKNIFSHHSFLCDLLDLRRQLLVQGINNGCYFGNLIRMPFAVADRLASAASCLIRQIILFLLTTIAHRQLTYLIKKERG